MVKALTKTETPVWLIVATVAAIFMAGAGHAEGCTGVFTTVVERMQLRWSNGSPSHPQYAQTRMGRWNVIDFSQPQEIPGKPTVPALPEDVCAVDLNIQVGGMIGYAAEDIAIWVDFQPFGAGGVCGQSAYTDTIVTRQMRGLRDSIGQITVPLHDRKLEWCWVVRSNMDASGRYVSGPNSSAPYAQLTTPGRAGALVNIGLLGWRY